MRQHVPPQQLWNEFHGDLEFEYDHSIYWPALKGGNAPSVGQSSVSETVQAAEVTKESAPLPVEASEKVEDVKVPVQSNGTQADGNMDILAVPAEPVITTGGDRP